MIRNPYNITLASTKKNIFTVVLTVVLIIVGFVLMANEGFGKTTNLATVTESHVDGFQFTYVLYTINFVFAIITAFIAIAIIIARRDILGVVTGLILLLFLLLIFTVGYKNTSGGIAGISEKNNFTLPVMLIENIKQP